MATILPTLTGESGRVADHQRVRDIGMANIPDTIEILGRTLKRSNRDPSLQPRWTWKGSLNGRRVSLNVSTQLYASGSIASSNRRMRRQWTVCLFFTGHPYTFFDERSTSLPKTIEKFEKLIHSIFGSLGELLDYDVED